MHDYVINYSFSKLFQGIHDLENMSLKEKLNFLRVNKQWKCYVKWVTLEEHEKTWKTNGLTDLTYAILA